MESKYYTPKIEEFCVGFEYEVFQEAPKTPKEKFLSFMPIETEDKWYKFRYPDFFLGYNLDKIFKTYKDIRVKYLDREDIESLNWCSVIPSNVKDKNNYVVDYWVTDLYEDCFQLLKIDDIKYQISFGNPEKNKVLFEGIILNKSELKKIMQQLNIYT